MQQEMSYKIRIHPASNRVNISDLKKVDNGRITGSDTTVEVWPYPPVSVSCLSSQILVAHDHSHARFHAQKDRSL